MSNTPSAEAFDKALSKNISCHERIYINMSDFCSFTNLCKNCELKVKAIKQAIATHIIGEDLPVYGAENEAGDVSLDSYMNSAVNSRLSEQRQTLYPINDK